MSQKTFRLPDLGEGLTESEIVTWRVASGDSEWCSGEPMPPPKGMRMVTGIGTAPRVRARSLARFATIWSNAGYTKPSNWISTTGR